MKPTSQQYRCQRTLLKKDNFLQLAFPLSSSALFSLSTAYKLPASSPLQVESHIGIKESRVHLSPTSFPFGEICLLNRDKANVWPPGSRLQLVPTWPLTTWGAAWLPYCMWLLTQYLSLEGFNSEKPAAALLLFLLHNFICGSRATGAGAPWSPSPPHPAGSFCE